jgi:hypothetical protein
MDRLNSWLTLLANVGVVVGLVLVVVEVRQNTDIARLQAYRENSRELTDWRTQMLSDPSLVIIFNDYWAAGRIDEATATERTRIGMMVNNLFAGYENAYLAYKFGIIEEQEWLRFLPPACMHLERVRRNAVELRFLTAEFKNELDSSCEKLPEHLRMGPFD